MAKKQLVALFICNLIGWTILQSILNLLPVYAVQLGASQALAGNLLAVAFMALAASALAAGWLSDKFQRRKFTLVVAGLLNISATWLMGQVTEFWQVVLLTFVVYFLIGLGFTTIAILAGLFAEVSERGQVFGLLAINASLGALIGGVLSGKIVDQWGYPTLFLFASVCWILQPVIVLFLRDKTFDAKRADMQSTLPEKHVFGKTFYLFLLANLIAFGASFFAVLGRPLLMDQLHYDAASISGVVALGGAVSLPLPFLFGWLSDRVNRYWLIVACFLVSAFGLVALAASLSLWHFGVSAILLSGVGVSLGVGPALVTDFVPPSQLGRALSWYNFSPSMGGILGFAFAGYAFQSLGMQTTLLGGAFLTLVAIVLVIGIQRTKLVAREEGLVVDG